MTDLAIPNRVEKGEYHIEFETRGEEGFLRSVKITIEVDMLPDDGGMPKDQQTRYNVALTDHPLYKNLEKYVLANPSKKYNFDQKSRDSARLILMGLGVTNPATGLIDRVQKMVKSAMIWAQSHK